MKVLIAALFTVLLTTPRQEGAPLQLVGKANDDASTVITHVQVEGNLAIANSKSDIVLYDFAVPRSPRFTGRYSALPAAEVPESGMVVGAARRRALVAIEGKPVQVVDFANPAKPKMVASHNARGTVRAAVIGTNYGALGFTDNDKHTGGIEFLDLTDGANPRPLGVVELPQPVHRMVRRIARIVVAHPDGGLSVLDVRDVARPKVVGSLAGDPAAPLGAPNLAVSGDGNLAYLTRTNAQSSQATLTVVDLKNPAQPAAIAQLNFAIAGRSDAPLVVQGSRVMILTGTPGVLTVDMREPARPVSASTRPFPAGVSGEGLGHDDIHLFVATGKDGLMLFQQPSAKR